MPDNDYSELLPTLRFNLRETAADCDCECGGTFTDEELLTLLDKHGGDVNAATYEGMLIKVEDDSIKLPDGLDLPSSRDYWLRLASLYRPIQSKNIPRADEQFNAE